MAEVHIVDIDGEQWDIKDLPLTTRVANLEEKLTKNFTYSATEEVDTGMTWINNKKIYRKVFVINALARNNISTGLPAGTEILHMWVRGRWASNANSGPYTVTDVQYTNMPIPFYTISEDGTTFSPISSDNRYVKDITIEYVK